jgi:anti-sigma factor RsiW
MDCGTVQGLLAERVRGELDAAKAAELDRHVAACEACTAERAIVEWLRGNAVVPPAGLEGRIRAAVHADPTVVAGGAGSGTHVRFWMRRRTWALASAAVAVLALGTTTLLNRGAGPSEEEVWAAFFDGVRSVWVAGDGVVADAPVLDDLSDLSDDQLAALLEELEG